MGYGLKVMQEMYCLGRWTNIEAPAKWPEVQRVFNTWKIILNFLKYFMRYGVQLGCFFMSVITSR